MWKDLVIWNLITKVQEFLFAKMDRCRYRFENCRTEIREYENLMLKFCGQDDFVLDQLTMDLRSKTREVVKHIYNTAILEDEKGLFRGR